MGSKCTGEPSTNMAVAVMNAIRNAIQAGQIGMGIADSTTWVPLSKLIYGTGCYLAQSKKAFEKEPSSGKNGGCL